MLKVLLMLDCDDCGYPLSQSTVCSDRDPMIWQAAGEDLIYEATKQGWDFYKDQGHCPECILAKTNTAKNQIAVAKQTK